MPRDARRLCRARPCLESRDVYLDRILEPERQARGVFGQWQRVRRHASLPERGHGQHDTRSDDDRGGGHRPRGELALPRGFSGEPPAPGRLEPRVEARQVDRTASDRERPEAPWPLAEPEHVCVEPQLSRSPRHVGEVLRAPRFVSFAILEAAGSNPRDVPAASADAPHGGSGNRTRPGPEIGALPDDCRAADGSMPSSR